MRPSTAQLIGPSSPRLVRGSIAIGAISVLVLALTHTATHSSAAAAPAGQPALGQFDAAAMAGRTDVTSRDTARLQTPELLVQERSASLAQTAAELTAAHRADSLQARAAALGAAAEQIDEQSQLLTDRTNFLMPTTGGFASRYGPRLHPILGYTRLHNGDDIGGSCGQPIWAAHDGTVTKAATGGYNGGSGNNVRLNAGKIDGVKVETAYLHMTDVAVRVGQKVHKGQLLGTVGNTGLSTACHLHFSVYENGRAIAPKKYLH